MSDSWLYGELGQTQPKGPVTKAELGQLFARGEITRQSIVWNDQMPDWLPIGDVPELRDMLSGGGAYKADTDSLCVQLVGAKNSGKTSYINKAMMSLAQNARSKYNLLFENEGNGLHESIADTLAAGYTPEATDYPCANNDYQFSLTPPGKTKKSVVVCDVSGEAFDEDKDTICGNTKIGSADAIMMIIDPMSMSISGYLLGKLIDITRYAKNTEGQVDMCLAVVITKYETQNKSCEQFLVDSGLGDVLNDLKGCFKNIQFFTCSALGPVDGMKYNPSYVPVGVDEPLLWLAGM